jgi:hypothetical protein
MKKHMKDMRKLTLRKEAIQTLSGLGLAQAAGGIQRPPTGDCTNPPLPLTGCSTAC